MDAASIQALLAAHLENCEITVQGEGSHFEIQAKGEVFAGLRPVARQQLVYAALGDHIADGSIHAVNIKTFTPDESGDQGSA
jgi:acid stress-induced BolA-like protein IbaG/YrbA